MNKPIKLGSVADLRTYKDYFPRFYSQGVPRVVEIHILTKDIASPDFGAKLAELQNYLAANKAEQVAFHAPDRLMQSVLFSEQSPTLAEDKALFARFFDTLKQVGAGLQQDVLAVVHQGIKRPASTFEGMSDAQVDALRARYIAQARTSYEALCSSLAGSRVIPVLENSPPFSAADGSVHFIDMAFEDIGPRLGSRGFVLDVCHATMTIAYYRQDKVRHPGLEAARRAYGGIPPSLRSLENYIAAAGKNTRWLHVSDATGMYGADEGKVPGNGGLIDFPKMMAGLRKHVETPMGVLELVDSHKDYSLIEKSFAALKPLLQ
jgi:hypothetical protein